MTTIQRKVPSKTTTRNGVNATPTGRAQTGRKHTTVASRYEALIDGTLSIEELDDEELSRGQLRDKDGGFKGRPPKWIPQEFYKMARIEWSRRQASTMGELLEKANEAAKDLLEAKHLQPGDGAKATVVKMVWDRTLGKQPDTTILVTPEVQETWQERADARMSVSTDWGELTAEVVHDSADEPKQKPVKRPPRKKTAS